MNLPNARSSKGFSLIELMVVVSIMIALMSIGVAAYNNFAKTATLDGNAKEFKANLRLVESFALNGEKIGSSCVGTFKGYYVTLANSATTYELGQSCDFITPRTPPSPVKLPTGMTIQSLTSAGTPTSPITILFQSVRGVSFYNCVGQPCFTTEVPGPIAFQVSLNGSSRTITITSDGKIE